jgi:ribosome-associated protein
MRKVTTFCDYFVICSGSSHRMVRAISDDIREGLERRGIWAGHTEGLKEASWILIDYADVIVHIFYEETRPFYNLEWLWNDAKKLRLKTG